MSAPVVESLALLSPITAFTRALAGEPCQVVAGEDRVRDLPLGHWSGSASPGDRAVLAHCRGRTLDVGCGPGRLAAVLAAEGHEVAGIDVVPAAVSLTRARGVPAWSGDIFDDIVPEGVWDTVLLADGNIGIGGCPARLLRRVARLLTAGGRVVVDLAPYGVGVSHERLRLRCVTGDSAPFRWSVVGADAIGELAEQAGLAVLERHEYAGRWCAVLGVGR